MWPEPQFFSGKPEIQGLVGSVSLRQDRLGSASVKAAPDHSGWKQQRVPLAHSYSVSV